MAEEAFRRKLTTVFSADVAGYSRLMGQDEAATVKTLTAYRRLMAELIKQHRGRVIDSPGDNLLAEFASVVDAVQCAVAVQKEFQARNAGLPEDRRMEFRIGINLGDVIEEEERIYGDGVNIAARLETLAYPGGICISKTAFDHIESKLPLGYEYLGERTVKNIAKPIGAYRVLMEPRVTVAEAGEEGKAWPMRRKAVLAGAVVLAAVVIAALIWHFYLRPSPPPIEPASVERMAFPLPDNPSLAVLPFENLSGDPKQEYFADGMTDDLITDLSKISGVFVIARNSTFAYKDKHVKVRQVAEELGVRYVLEGSVRRAGDQVRVNAQLIDATTGHHLWAERYDGVVDNIFELQDKITQKIVAALAVKLTTDQQKEFARGETDNIAAYDALLKGWEHSRRVTREDVVKAVSYFKEAIELDPNYGRAYAALARLYWSGGGLGFFHDLSLGETGLLARKYLQMAMNYPTSTAHVVASEMSVFHRRHQEAIAQAERAIALDPNDPNAHAAMAYALNWAGRPQEAVDSAMRAMRLDPRFPAGYVWSLGMAHFAMGQLEEAVTWLERAITLYPEVREGYSILLAPAYAHLGRDQEARTALEDYEESWEGFTPNLRDVMYWFPFKDPEVADRFADGLLKAGLAGEPAGYYKFSEEDKLSGEEIRALVFGRTISGFFPGTGHEWWMDCAEDGKSTFRGPLVELVLRDSDSDSGMTWIEGDMLWRQWQRVFPGLKICETDFRNPEGTPEMKNEYISCKDKGFMTWSPVD